MKQDFGTCRAAPWHPRQPVDSTAQHGQAQHVAAQAAHLADDEQDGEHQVGSRGSPAQLRCTVLPTGQPAQAALQGMGHKAEHGGIDCQSTAPVHEQRQGASGWCQRLVPAGYLQLQARARHICKQAPRHLTLTVVGPAREGIQKKPSVSRPSSATLDSALRWGRACEGQQGEQQGEQQLTQAISVHSGPLPTNVQAQQQRPQGADRGRRRWGW